MNKFLGLFRFLFNNSIEEMILTFADIEKLNGRVLCYSAYTYDAYWRSSGNHTLANTIEDCGYKIVEVNLNEHYIIIRKQQ